MAGANPPSTSSDLFANSSAVVKYSSVQFPMRFPTIRLNTDLNVPPAGCSPTGNPEETQQFSRFLSVNMANTYPDLVGKVDVISSSKNIKSLLKLPFSESPRISVMVHRLRKTLLLEEFDVNKYLFRNESDDWDWLRSYFNKIVSKGERKSEDRMKCLVSAAKHDQHTDNMYINLIRHSFAAACVEKFSPYSVMELGDHTRQVNSLSEPSEEALRGFHHETLWKLEDISMLIDSDLPIFGNGATKRPCISLRLRDARSPPINVLTGLDYWLDNLMSNVPEVAMCYHINGIVQKYEVIRTEDIPELDNSKFDPQDVMDIARNIMAFIKSNAAVEGHTYWLYKSENDETVKLYDLTDHCKTEISADDNPFTVPVGLLCFRAAHKIKTSDQRRNADARALFENCLALLDETKHGQTCSSAHFHLSDMWVPNRSVNDIWSDRGKLSEPPSDLYDEEGSSEDSSDVLQEALRGDQRALTASKMEEPVQNEVALRELFVRGMIKKKAWDIVQSCRIAGETDERCKMALSHIRKGLNIIDRDQARGKNIGLVEPQRTCSPSKAIPMHYSPLRPQSSAVDRNGTDEAYISNPSDKDEIQRECCPSRPIPLHDAQPECGAEASQQVTSREPPSEQLSAGIFPSWLGSDTATVDTWHINAKLGLLWKATVSYFVLAKSYFEIRKLGHTLRHLRYAMHCYECLELLNPKVCEDLANKEIYFLMKYLAAQARSCLTQATWHSCYKEFQELGEEEAAILSSAQALVTTPKNEWMYTWSNSLEENYHRALDMYKQCRASPEFPKRTVDFKTDVKKNQALTLFHLGNLNMEVAKENFEKCPCGFNKLLPLWKKSMQRYLEAIKAFEGTNDHNTTGHIYCNMAFLYILAGNAVVFTDYTANNPLPKKGKEFYFTAIEHWEKSLDILDRQEQMDATRENIFNSLRHTYHQLASRLAVLLPDHISQEQLCEMKELVQKSLSLCQVDGSSPNLQDHQLHAASNYVMLAKTFEAEKKFRNPRKKGLQQKSEESFQKAFELYGKVKHCKSQIHVKDLWIKCILDSKDMNSMTDLSKKRLYRWVMAQLCELQLVVETIMIGEGDLRDEQNTDFYPSYAAALKRVLTDVNWAFNGYLKIDKTCTSVKDMYQRSLRLTCQEDHHTICPVLNQVLYDLKKFLNLDSS